MSLDEAAHYLSVSKDSLRRWTRQGTLACLRLGARRERRFRREDLDRFLDPNPAAQARPSAAALSTDPPETANAAARVDLPELLSIDGAARYMRVSKSSLRRWTRLGTLACVRVGARRERRFRREDLDRFLDPSSVRQVIPPAAIVCNDPLETLNAAALDGVPRHVCLHFRDRDELWQLFRPYVLDHAKHRLAIVYIHEENSRADVFARLRAEGLDAKRMMADGLLRLLVPSQAYLRSGSFAPGSMIDFVESAILDRRAAGHEAMLVSGEMIWRLCGAPGVDGMDEYEMRLNDLLLRYPKVTIVCHYDMHRLSGAVTLGALCTHPHVQLPTGLLPGYFARAQAPL